MMSSARELVMNRFEELKQEVLAEDGVDGFNNQWGYLVTLDNWLDGIFREKMNNERGYHVITRSVWFRQAPALAKLWEHYLFVTEIEGMSDDEILIAKLGMIGG